MMNENLIIHTFVVDSKGIIKYSTLRSLVGQTKEDPLFKQMIAKLAPPNDLNDDVITKYIKLLLFERLNNHIYSNITKLPNGNTILMFFFLGNITQINSIFWTNILLGIVFILVGAIAASALARQLTTIDTSQE